jgi:ribonuclease P protein component
MLPKKLRLPARSPRGGAWTTKKPSPFFTIRTRPNQLGHPRIAVAVGLKVDKRATRRHLIKRRVVAMLREWEKGNRDIIVSVMPPAAELSRKTFIEELKRSLGF